MSPVVATPRTLRDACATHYARSGFSAADYAAPWVRFKTGPVTFVFPNWPSRARALSLHDAHHGLTGYDTSLAGEAEIAAWEVAAGCGRHSVAWFFELQAFGLGLALCPRRLWRGFLRGRAARANLYQYSEMTDELLDTPLEELRRRLGLDERRTPTLRDRLAFALWSTVGGVMGFAALVAYVLPITWLAYFGLHAAYALRSNSSKAQG
jgi:hypothetical protein